MLGGTIVLPTGQTEDEAMEVEEPYPPRGEDSDPDMRKERGIRQTNGSQDNQSEPCQKISYTPSKKGGTFGLPMGASVSVPPGSFGKKDTVTCHVASPSERWRFCPTLPSNERITSEIFTLTSSQQPLKRPIVLQMPYYSTDLEFSELNVKGRWEGEPNWVDVGFISKDGRKPMVELQLDRVGSFVVTVTPKRELFNITTQGCLYNARISRYISVRFPKKAVDTDMPCCLKINPIPTEKIELAKEQCPHQCGDLERISEFIDIVTDGPRSFRRAATIKLPLPAGLDSDTDDTADVAVLQKMGDTWDIIENNCRFTKTTVTFDVKTISRFCVAQAKSDRRKRLKEAVKVLEERTNKLKGEVLAFVSVEEKSWVVLVEVVSEDEIENRTIFRGTKGFRPLKKSPIVKPEPEVFRFSRRTQTKPPTKPREPEPVIIEDSMKWTIELGQDVKVGDDSEMEISSVVQYFENLPECYRRFKIEPKTDEERALCGSISVIPVNENSRDNASYLFKLEISEDDVKEYFKPEYVPPPPPEKPEPYRIEVPIEEVSPPKPAEPAVPRFRSLPQDVMDRLTKSNKRPVILEKESKVLTGKSLMALARVVQEGLTLAVHLDLPDSTITGIGFDALSNGHGMVDVTYKILLHWKRGLKDKKDAAVEQLCLALRDMGRQGAAMAVLERHRDNKELDMACFEITSV